MTNSTFYAKIGISAKEHDQFVTQHPQINLLQSSAWASVKKQWQNERIGIYQGDKQVASMSVLIRPLPMGFSLIYIPRGPVMDYDNLELVKFTIKTLKTYGKGHKALFIKCDPAILLKQYQIGETSSELPAGLKAIEHLKKAGAYWTGLTTAISESIQPRFQANIHTQDDIENTFAKHTKRLMKDAKRRGVETYRGNQSDIETFSKLVGLTEERQKISLRNEAYFKSIMDIYGDDAYLHIATINISQKLADYKSQLIGIEQDIASTAPHQKKRLSKLQDQQQSLQKYISEFETYAVTYPDKVAIAGILSISYGNVMEMLYAGMNADFKKCYPQYLLYPTVFKDAHEHQIIWANMGGVEGTLDDGLTKFKANFNPTIEEFIGEFNIPVSPFYHAANSFYNIRKYLRHKS